MRLIRMFWTYEDGFRTAMRPDTTPRLSLRAVPSLTAASVEPGWRALVALLSRR